MKIRVNVLSKSLRVPELDWVANLTEPAPVFHTGVGRVVGTTSKYEIEGEDVWAVLEIEEGLPAAQRAAAMVADLDTGRTIAGVMLTNLSRDLIRTL